jgi:WD40 repeat protein
MRRAVPLALAAVLAVLIPGQLRASACPAQTCGVSSAAIPGSSLLALRPAGVGGPLFGYDLSAGRLRFSLPRGQLSADGRRFFAARVVSGTTRISGYDGLTGRAMGSWTLPGSWWLARTSSSGRWLALVRSGNNVKATSFAVVDAQRRVVAHRLRLAKRWDVDAISRDGKRLFLVQWFPSKNTPSYGIRLYDLVHSRLAEVPVKSQDASMVGTPWTAVASADGRRLLTLYVTPSGGSFVHALDLRAGTATCIDLPDKNVDLGSLGAYTTVLSGDGGTLFAANPALGVVHVLDLNQGRLARTLRFKASQADLTSGMGALSPDGKTLAFATGSFLWQLDVGSGGTVGRVDAGTAVLGLGFDASGRLVALDRTYKPVPLKVN